MNAVISAANLLRRTRLDREQREHVSMLLDAGYVEFDGLDEDDALERGFSLDELAPPRASSDAGLVGLMSVTLGRRA